MLRDSIKSEAYFEKYIQDQEKRIRRFQKMAAGLPETETEKIKRCNRVVANFQRDLICAKYSAGASKQELQKAYRKYLGFLACAGAADYAEYIDVLSMAIVLDVSLDDSMGILEECEFSDGLTGLLAGYIRNRKIGQEGEPLLYEDYYKIFQEYLIGNCKIAKLREYMEQEWYQASKEFAWYGSDESPEDIYTGYWCWLAGACVKIRGEEASSLELKYTPLDILR